ncbi:MAG: hypothetical protein KGJ89_00335 [Patescibacteria group bacterium]|nr:hypothetical protein [Patescibacteria group bacterium]MDE2014968.1 hypothetical protein [Patescibacteria group bacterium]MDE2226397.1 hypothetical protein [Patescibacteria group bacterium]
MLFYLKKIKRLPIIVSAILLLLIVGGVVWFRSQQQRALNQADQREYNGHDDISIVQLAHEAVNYLNDFYNMNHQFPSDHEWETQFLTPHNLGTYSDNMRTTLLQYDNHQNYSEVINGQTQYGPRSDTFLLRYDLRHPESFAVGELVQSYFCIFGCGTDTEYWITNKTYKGFMTAP